MGWVMGVEFKWSDLELADQGLYDPLFWRNYLVAERMGVFTDETLLLGGAGEHTADRGAPSLVGLHNYTSAASVAGGADDDADMTAGIVDWDDLMIKIKNSYKSNTIRRKGKIILFITSGLAAEFMKNDNSTGETKTLYQRFQEKWMHSGAIDAIYIDDNLQSATLSTSNQRFLCINTAYIRRFLVFPLQRKNMLNKQYEGDVRFAMLQGHVLLSYDANAIIVRDTTDITTSHAGYEFNSSGPNDPFMTAYTSGPKPVPP
jgi:hypothetical protein